MNMCTVLVFRNLANQIMCFIFSFLLLVRSYSIALRYGCPARPLIKPCSCQEITKGLDVSCEGNIDISIQYQLNSSSQNKFR